MNFIRAFLNRTIAFAITSLAIAFLCLAFLCLSACKAPSTSASVSEGPGRTEMVEDKANENWPKSDYEKLVLDTKDYFRNRNFRAIEKRAENFRDKKERFDGGAWKLKAVYEAVVWPEDGDRDDDQAWENHFNKLREWKNKFPESATASISLAQSYVHKAWTHKSCSCDKTKDPAAEKIKYYDLVEMAGKELEASAHLKNKCPESFLTMLMLAQAVRADSATFEAIFQAGLKYEPQYLYLYDIKAYNLHPMWGGKPGDWEKFADEVAAGLGGREGSALYYSITVSMLSRVGLDSLQQEQISWERMKQGYVDYQALYGTNYEITNEFAYLAFLVEDQDVFCSSIKTISYDDRDAHLWSERRFVSLKQNCETRELDLNRAQIAKEQMPPQNEQNP